MSEMASAMLPQFKAVNTLLSNLKTALKGTCNAFDFVKHAQRSATITSPAPD